MKIDLQPTGLLLAAVILLPALASSLDAADWPQWRGPDRTDISTETGLLKKWPAAGPRRVWLSRGTGIGYSGPAVVGSSLYIMGSHNKIEHLQAVDVQSGAEQWKTQVGPVLTNGWGDGPRATPTVDGNRVYAMGGRGNLVCVQATDGKLVWQKQMKDLGGKVPSWGYTESVLVDGDRVVCTPGGRSGAIVALNKMTGERIWQSKDFTEGAQYASVIAVKHNDTRQYVQLTMKKLVGVAADSGNVLWVSDWPGRTAVIPTPIFHDGSVYITSGYGVGCERVEIGSDYSVKSAFRNKNLQNHHGGVIFKDGHLYGHCNKNGWVCQDFKTGEIVWKSKKLGKGAVTCAEGMLYCVGESDGQVVLIEASPDGWKEHGRFTLDPQTKLRKPKGKVWTHPVIADGRLYLRDQELLYCYDIKAR
ncbi:MAG: PQQ-binding-like beta-propeller repeat protein [Phycisphaerae bacterium]|nr:PQQ-binding-like beta-propeller repeat protein [Phycisphaerae bacterium]